MTILPLCCFPNIHWFRSFCNGASICDVYENYVKQSLRNRFELYGPNGRFSLTVPVEGQKGLKMPFKDVRIVDDGWNILHKRSMQTAYGSAPFFEHYADEVNVILDSNHKFLLDLNVASIEFLSTSFELDADLILSDSYVESMEINDLRPAFKREQSSGDFGEYYQVFREKNGFESNLSALDLLFNEGPYAQAYLNS